MGLDRLGFTRVARMMLVVGILMLVPAACTIAGPPAPDEDDVGVAFAEVARIRLDSFRPGSPIRLTFSVPDTARWRRLRTAWGDHGYIVYGVRKEHATPWLIPFSNLNLDVMVSRAGRPVAVQKSTECPYLISVSSLSDRDECARSFKPTPGAQVEIALIPRTPGNVPEGDLVIQPSWEGHEKDRIVGAMIDSDVRPYVLGAGAVGIVLLIASSVLAIKSASGIERT